MINAVLPDSANRNSSVMRLRIAIDIRSLQMNIIMILMISDDDADAHSFGFLLGYAFDAKIQNSFFPFDAPSNDTVISGRK
jgi:hypothetical protein